MAPGELSFVYLSGKTAQDTQATNKRVRAHVMRRYKQQQRAQARTRASMDVESTRASYHSLSTVGGRAVSPSSNESIVDQEFSLTSGSSHGSNADLEDAVTHSFRPCDSELNALADQDGDYALGSQLRLIPLTTWLGGSLDPFSCLPVPSTARSMMLLQQNATSTIRTSVHADPNDSYRKACSKDPAWLFMNMFYAASRFPEALRQKPSENTDYLLKSMSSVNESITRSPIAISDSTIATVSCLANIENLNGVASDATVHMNGLIRMVEIRGGLDNLGFEGILRRMVLWSDLLNSSRSAQVPRFPFYEVDTSLHLSYFTPSASRSEYLLAVNQDLTRVTTTKYGIEISQILLSLHELSSFLNLLGNRKLPWDACYPDRVYEVEYHILMALFGDMFASEFKDETRISIILLHSSLLFLYTNLRETPVGGAIRKRLLSRLKDALCDADLSHLSEDFTAEMLWSFFLGASAATGDDQAFFLKKIYNICFDHHIQTWSDVQNQLAHVPALESRCLARSMELWEGVEPIITVTARSAVSRLLL